MLQAYLWAQFVVGVFLPAEFGLRAGNPDATAQLRGTLPYAEFLPQSSSVGNQPSNDESQPTTYEEPINAAGVVSNSASTGYEAPNVSFTSGENAINQSAPYTAYEQTNQREPDPAHTERNSSASHQQLSGTPSVASTFRDNDTVMNDDFAYVYPNRIEYEQVPDARSTDSYQAQAASTTLRVKSERAVSNTDAAYLSFTCVINL